MKNMHWNMVEEKLPAEYENVLVCVLEKDDDGEWSVYSFDMSSRDRNAPSGWAMGSLPPEDFKIEFWAEPENPYES